VEKFLGDSVHLNGKFGTLQLIAIHLITLHKILEYLQIAVIQMEAAHCEHLYLYHSQKVWPRLYIGIPFVQM
jgi:hypothetical protein